MKILQAQEEGTARMRTLSRQGYAEKRDEDKAKTQSRHGKQEHGKSRIEYTARAGSRTRLEQGQDMEMKRT